MKMQTTIHRWSYYLKKFESMTQKGSDYLKELSYLTKKLRKRIKVTVEHYKDKD